MVSVEKRPADNINNSSALNGSQALRVAVPVRCSHEGLRALGRPLSPRPAHLQLQLCCQGALPKRGFSARMLGAQLVDGSSHLGPQCNDLVGAGAKGLFIRGQSTVGHMSVAVGAGRVEPSKSQESLTAHWPRPLTSLTQFIHHVRCKIYRTSSRHWIFCAESRCRRSCWPINAASSS